MRTHQNSGLPDVITKPFTFGLLLTSGLGATLHPDLDKTFVQLLQVYAISHYPSGSPPNPNITMLTRAKLHPHQLQTFNYIN